jgi:hypothetical protein
MNRFTLSRRHLPGTKRPARARPVLELLEDRTVLNSYTAATVKDLIKDIVAANTAGGSNTITLAASKTFTVSAPDATNPSNGLPAITNGNLTNRGNGDMITRGGDAAFRFFDVASGALLTLKEMTISHGLVIGGTGAEADGGAILVEAGGTLTASYTTFTGNQALGGDGDGGPGGMGHGGAVENEGTANFDHDTFTDNQAMGGATGNTSTVPPDTIYGAVFGAAFGGAIANGRLGTLGVSCSLFTSNEAKGGFLGPESAGLSGSGYDGVADSGAISNWNAATVSNTTFADNRSIGGPSAPGVSGGYGIAGAVGSGGPFAHSTAMTISRCVFDENRAIGADVGPGDIGGFGVGGAVSNGYSEAGSSITITDSVFTANQANGGKGGFDGVGTGGALNLESPCTTTIDNCTFDGNQASRGGPSEGAAFGGAIDQRNYGIGPGGASGASLTISNTTFVANQANARGPDGLSFGGAIRSENDDWAGASAAPLSVSNCRFVANQVTDMGGYYAIGGAISNADYDPDGSRAPLTISNSVFLGNQALGAAGYGASTPTAAQSGAVDTSGATTILGSTFLGNLVQGGPIPAGAPDGSALTVSEGGALTGYLAPLDVRDSSFVGNQVIGSAGGPGVAGGIASGGAIEVFGDVTGYFPPTIATFSNCVLSGNGALGGAGGDGAPGGAAVGGALDVNSDATVTLTDTAATENWAIGGAGGAGTAGGAGMGGGCSVGTAVLFGTTDASSLTISGSWLDHNQAIGGAGGRGACGGNGQGGGVVVLSGSTAAFNNSIVTQNCALGGNGVGGSDGQGLGGGFYIDIGATVTISNTKVKRNHASTAGNEIYGTLG